MSQSRLKFAPVKLIVIESRGEYLHTVICSLGIGLTHLMLGAIIMVSIMYSMRTEDVHVALFTFAYCFFSAQAILSLSFVNGWSASFRLKHRKVAHVGLQLCGFCCDVTALALIANDTKGFTWTLHCITGLIAVFLTLASIATGPYNLLFRKKKTMNIIHKAIGLATFVVSSVCLCTGYFTPEFWQWAGLLPVCILLVFVIFFNITIVVNTLIRY